MAGSRLLRIRRMRKLYKFITPKRNAAGKESGVNNLGFLLGSVEQRTRYVE